MTPRATQHRLSPAPGMVARCLEIGRSVIKRRQLLVRHDQLNRSRLVDFLLPTISVGKRERTNKLYILISRSVWGAEMIECTFRHPILQPIIYVCICACLAFSSPALSEEEHHLGSPTLGRDAMCKDDPSAIVAEQVRRLFPESLSFNDRRRLRNQYIIRNRRMLFDLNKDGYLDFEEYLSFEWAGYLAQNESMDCRVTKSNFMMQFLGEPSNQASGWHSPSQVSAIETIYRETDVQNKGFIIKDDLRPRALRTFKQADKDGDGLLSPAELP